MGKHDGGLICLISSGCLDRALDKNLPAMPGHLIIEELEPCLHVLCAPKRYWTALVIRKGAATIGCVQIASLAILGPFFVRAKSI